MNIVIIYLSANIFSINLLQLIFSDYHKWQRNHTRFTFEKLLDECLVLLFEKWLIRIVRLILSGLIYDAILNNTLGKSFKGS